jgi:potassium-transporting ATPase potassium-binding subunit
MAYAQIVVYMFVLLVLALPLGGYIARVYSGESRVMTRIMGPAEHLIYRLLRIDVSHEMTPREYVVSVLLFSLLGLLFTFLVQIVQGLLPLNPAHMEEVSPDLAFNTAMSFVTNTNWQAYGGETTLSYLTQMLALAVQNFVSAAAAMAVLVALIRGFVRTGTHGIGSFWIDMTRTVLYVLLPLSFILALLLVSQGVVQTFLPYRVVATLDPSTGVSHQTIAVGPAASQIAIKQLGTNGGGFFNVNSAHPLENPTPFSNFLEMLSILLIPAALVVSFGRMVKDRRQGRAILAAMTVLFVGFLALTYVSERTHTPQMARAAALGGGVFHGGNLEGKELRFGVVNSAIWATATTAASNGSVNSMHDSFNPLGGLSTMLLIELGEVIYGGVGSGLYSMLFFAILTVFVAGLMVGRTPEYLGKKIEPYEMKAATFAVLLTPILSLLGTAAGVLDPNIIASLNNPGPHGFSEILYAFSSGANNNGSAFGGFGADTPFLNIAIALVMMIGRFGTMVAAILAAGSLAKKQHIAVTNGTLATHTPLFTGLLIAIVLVVGALSFFPALSLGPIVEQLLSAR